ncbi:hypothetical protein [Nocardioides bruguierae]|uniref:Uncharacterized protein n=1 Tax=Nocardioides bruguierae TaxID=2945102 RepID=A0A9X2IGB2_9ACTN|nr:hypothetical protein [Nocardioides bruguierae]MCM0622192.1 hypothetical protein [Nocardioides bruguierae]
MISVFHYNGNPLPVGNPVSMNGSRQSYALGFYDGADYGEQYADEPEEGVLFQSPEAAEAWLEAVTAVLTPYIETGDRSARRPDPDGWSEK